MSQLVFILMISINIIVIIGTNAPPKDPGLVQSKKPNFDAVQGLICYQCRSMSNDLQPLCDSTIFKLSTPEEKYNMTLQCPNYQDAFCFTKISTVGELTETVRGCSKDVDKNGNKLKVGCMTTDDLVLCLCDQRFCNQAPVLSLNFSYFVLIILRFTF